MRPGTSRSWSPRSGELVTEVDHTSAHELGQVLLTAASAARTLQGTTPRERRGWLEATASALAAHADELVGLAAQETGLGEARLRGELAKVVAQTRFYGEVAEEGSFLGATIDHEHDLHRINRPIGPVAVFGSSNFPFVLGVVGHDTASALAAGCPVVAKIHDAHVGLGTRLSEVVRAALAAVGAPVGTFDAVVGFDAGVALVRAEEVAAVAFTGSEAGGRAIWQMANERVRPVPVYAEMGTVNPVVVTREGSARIEEVAAGFVSCFTGDAGQYCTKPGLLLVPSDTGAVNAVVAAFDRLSPSEQPMLTATMAREARRGTDALVQAGATVVGRHRGGSSAYAVEPTLLTAPAELIAEGSRLLEECFGPVAVVVEYPTRSTLESCVQAMQPALVAAVWTSGEADAMTTDVVELLAGKVGRVVVDGWTTGAPHSWAQHHGGPWPATSTGSATSIGAAALDRFVRPVAYQSVPAHALPEALRAIDRWGITQRVDGGLRPARG